jgi:heme exporter protein D
MEQLSTYLAMSGYGAFIWPSFGISTLVLGGLIIESKRFLKSTEAELAMLRDNVEEEEPAT